MRILLVTEDVPSAMLGGAGQHAVVLGNALIEAGHDVHLLGYRNVEAGAAANDFAGPLHRLIDFGGARWQENALGVFMPQARPHTARRLWQAVQQLPGPWDAVHYHGHNALLGALVPPSWNFIHTLHDQGAECITRMRFRAGAPCETQVAADCAGCATARPNPLQRWLSTQAVMGMRAGTCTAFARHRAVFVSAFLRDRLGAVLGADAPGADSCVQHNFVDTRRLRAALSRQPPRSDDGRLRVFAAGRIDAAKGFAPWLAALPDAALQRLHVTIAGDGPELAALRQRHERRGVVFLGWRSPAEVLQATLAADVCVVPSVCEEACSTTVLEALSLGRSVFALARGGTPELAIYGEPGQLRLFDDLDALAAALVQAPVRTWPANERASIEARLPRLLALYAARALQPLPAQVAA